MSSFVYRFLLCHIVLYLTLGQYASSLSLYSSTRITYRLIFMPTVASMISRKYSILRCNGITSISDSWNHISERRAMNSRNSLLFILS